MNRTMRHLQNSEQRRKRVKGWTAERRALQVAVVRRCQPWRRATGPRTATGKAVSARNAIKHGFRSRAHVENLRRVRRALALAAFNIACVRAWLRARKSSTANSADAMRTMRFRRLNAQIAATDRLTLDTRNIRDFAFPGLAVFNPQAK
jgi:hypothetical protein